jgi:hypothetical protein
MSTRWQTTELGTFEVVDRQSLAGGIFGSFMLFFAGCFLYWLGTAVVELVRFGTWGMRSSRCRGWSWASSWPACLVSRAG